MLFSVILRVFLHVFVHMFVFVTVSLTAFSCRPLAFGNCYRKCQHIFKKACLLRQRNCWSKFFSNHKNCIVQNCLKHFDLEFFIQFSIGFLVSLKVHSSSIPWQLIHHTEIKIGWLYVHVSLIAGCYCHYRFWIYGIVWRSLLSLYVILHKEGLLYVR